MFGHKQKIELMAKIEERTGEELWMHNDGYIEYFAAKQTGKIVYILDGSTDKDEGYILELVSLSHNS